MSAIDIENFMKAVAVARCELKNVRQQMNKLRAVQKQDVEALKLFVSKLISKDTEEQNIKCQSENEFNVSPIGYVSSGFKNKNGTPRQSTLCQTPKASITINKTYFTNPEHSLIGLAAFSYMWILFIFHKNCKKSVKAKVHPPRLNGTSTGVFSTRSPHRPCAIGLSLVKIDNIIGSTIFFSGGDILDGTPVLDIKPYITLYDIPPPCREIEYFTDEKAISLKDSADLPITTKSSTEKSADESNDMDNILIENILDSLSELLVRPSNQLEVLFTERAMKDIEKFHSPACDINCNYCLNFIDNPSDAKQAITEVLQNDPRSVYRKNKCSDKLYYFEIDNLHITCWFDDMIAEVLRVKPVNKYAK